MSSKIVNPMRVTRALLVIGVVLVVLHRSSSGASAHVDARTHRDNVVLQWNSALLQAVRDVRFAPMFTARALAVVHTCMYDAWAAYDARAVGTVLGDSLRRPKLERTRAAKRVAVSFAAYRAL